MRAEGRRQKFEGRSLKAVVSIRTGGRKIVLYCLLSSVFCLLSCSIPNLESAECAEARQPVKEFYSNYFGSEQAFAAENLPRYEKFLSAEFANSLKAEKPATDPFTLNADQPKAFRIGTCQVTEANKKVEFQILLFWKNDTRSEQKEIYAEAIKENDNWAINKIFNKN